MTWPLTIWMRSPGSATTRLMKLTSDFSGVGRGHGCPSRCGAPHCPVPPLSAPAGGWETTSAPAPAALGPGRRVEDDDVADRRVAEVRAEPVDEDALPDLQRGDHRLARDA